MDKYIAEESTRLSGTILDLVDAGTDTYDDTGELFYDDIEQESCGESLDG